MSYKLGSLFDGSGGFPLSGALCGVEPVWAAEVEPYPIAVTRSRFPNMKHLGDISKIHGGEIEPVDIITFGSPCQDLSVAGKRAGLKHEANGDEETTRSGLFMEAVRMIKEMREATGGKFPRFALWENVQGAFSSNKGEDFRVVCEELIKIVEPSASMPSVPKGGWAYADSYVGDGWSLAYRVFDAQYWGVPQRRRRIYLVADFGGQCAREVLFEREGLRGYFATGRTPWQAAPCDAQGSAPADDRAGEGFDGVGGRQLDDVAVPYTLKIRAGVEVDSAGKAAGKGALVQKDLSATRGVTQDQYLFQPAVYTRGYGGSVTLDGVSPTLEARAGTGGNNQPIVAYSFDSLASNSMKSSNPHSGCREVGVAKTLDTTDPNPSKNQGGIAIVVPVYCLQGNGIDRADTAGCNGKGVKEDISYTLNTIDRPAVAYLANGEPVAGTLCSGAAQRGFSGGQEIFNGNYHIIEETSSPVRYIVRRLTPTECARLQGFADWWGIVEQKDSLTDEEYQFWLEVRNTHAAINGKKVQDYTKAQMLTWYNKLWTDSAEYKMWGNGISLPTALFCLQGIVDALNKPEEDDDSWLM